MKCFQAATGTRFWWKLCNHRLSPSSCASWSILAKPTYKHPKAWNNNLPYCVCMVLVMKYWVLLNQNLITWGLRLPEISSLSIWEEGLCITEGRNHMYWCELEVARNLVCLVKKLNGKIRWSQSYGISWVSVWTSWETNCESLWNCLKQFSV